MTTYTRLRETPPDMHGLTIPIASGWLLCNACGAVTIGAGRELHDTFHAEQDGTR